MKQKTVTTNDKERLFIIPCYNGFTCLGFDVCRERAARLAGELGEMLTENYRAKKFESPLDLYADYMRLVELAREKHKKTGWRSNSELVPQLIGLEYKQVEIVHKWKNGTVEKSRFFVGKSLGFIPCHLELKSRRSASGSAVCLGTIQSLRVIK